jgi:hypothetical protein
VNRVPVLRGARAADVDGLAGRLRASDLRELEASHGLRPRDALEMGLHLSRAPRTVELPDGRPAGMFGVVPQRGAPDVGVVWMLGSDELVLNATWFLRMTARELPRQVAGLSWAHNLVDERNRQTLGWLFWLGFHVADRQAQYGRAGLPFLHVVLDCRRVRPRHRRDRDRLRGGALRRVAEAEDP